MSISNIENTRSNFGPIIIPSPPNLIKKLSERKHTNALRTLYSRVLLTNSSTVKDQEPQKKVSKLSLKPKNIREHFLFSHLNKEQCHEIVESILNPTHAQHLLGVELKEPFSTANTIYPLLATILQRFSLFAKEHHPDWFNEKLLSEPMIKEIGDTIISTIKKSPLELLKRFQERRPIILELGDTAHSMTMLFFGRHLFYCNRGDPYKGQTQSLELYKFDPSNLNEDMISSIVATSGYDCEISDEFIYTEFKDLLECKKAEKFCSSLSSLPQPSEQTKNNCVVANAKLAIKANLIAYHGKNLTLNKLNKIQTIYKSFTSFLRDTIEKEYLKWKQNQ